MSKNTTAAPAVINLYNGSNVDRYGAYVFCLVYSLAHIWILFIPDALYWDDWTINDQSSAYLLEIFAQGGSIFNLGGYVNLAIQGAGSWSSKVVVFFSYLGSGLILDRILKRTDIFSYETRFSIVLLYLVLPLNFARIAQINVFYAISNFLFMAAWLLMDRHRVLASIMFLVSFGTNSLLVYYAIPFVDYIYRHEKFIFFRPWRRLTSASIFIFLPFFYWWVKNSFYKPSGMYAGYNQNLSILNVFPALQAQLIDFLGILGLLPSLLVFIFFASVIIFLLFLCPAGEKDSAAAISMIFSGMVLVALACFPYWVLGLVPSTWEWSSRHQLLMPFGVAVFVTGSLLIFSRTWRRISIFLLVVMSALCWATVYKEAYFDWRKQEYLVKNFSRNEALRGAGLVVIHDETTDLNVLDRKYRFYEWNGLMEKAFGDQNRFVISPGEIGTYLQGGLDGFFNMHYKAGQHVRDMAVAPLHVRIKHGDKAKDSALGADSDRVKSLVISIDY